MFSKPKWVALTAAFAAAMVALSGSPASAAVLKTYSFEYSMNGWQMGYAGDGYYNMYRSTTESFSGLYSIECYLDGTDGTGTAWLVHRYPAPIDTVMTLDLTFQLYSQQASSVNNWQVVAYIGTKPPTSKDQFEIIGYTDTVAGWQQYSFQRLQLTGQWPARVYVAFGISSTWEYSRGYYMDHVTVSLTP